MRRLLLHQGLLLGVVLFLSLLPAAAPAATDTDDILTAAESVFQAMQKGDHARLWKGLSAATQNAIHNAVLKAVEKSGDTQSEAVRRDMEVGGELARAYWAGYLSNFDPKTVLDESRWSMGEIRQDRAEIILRYRKSNQDAILKMYREQGAWKVGLDESFSARK